MRKALDVVVTYYGDAQDHISVDLLVSDPVGAVSLENKTKTTPNIEDAAEFLRDLITAVAFEIRFKPFVNAPLDLWGLCLTATHREIISG